MSTSKTKVIEREKIVAAIKNSGPDGISKKDLIDKTNFTGDFNYSMKKIMDDYSEIVKVGSKGVKNIYKWSPKKSDYFELKNPEGYNDHTAGKAISNVMRSSGKYPMRQHFGEVWSNNSGITDDQEGVLIISGYDGICICVNVYPTKKSFMKGGSIYTWSDEKGLHYISMLHLLNINERKLERKLFDIPEAGKEMLKNKLRDVLKIEPEVKTEVVTVEREVVKEVPIEVIKEVRTDEKEIEMLLLKQKVEIYERLLFAKNTAPIIEDYN